MLTQERVRELLVYNAKTGIFRWRKNAGRYGRIPAGTLAGGRTKEGYLRIGVDGVCYFATRLIWVYVHGHFPPDQVDHRNRNPSDDRLSNLRLATQSQNKANSRLYRNNSSGFKGVSYERARDSWVAFIKFGGERRKWLGRYKTKEAAYAAYCVASKEIHGEFSNPEKRQT